MKLNEFLNSLDEPKLSETEVSCVGDELDVVTRLASHVMNPCSEEVKSIYLNEARRVLPTIDNQFYRDFLNGVITEYS